MHKIDVIYTLKHVLSARTEKNHRIQGAFFVSQKLNFAMKHSRVNKLQKGRIYRYTLKAANQNKLQKKNEYYDYTTIIELWNSWNSWSRFYLSFFGARCFKIPFLDIKHNS